MYKAEFERLSLGGKIRRQSAIRVVKMVVKMWNFLSCLAEADITLGVYEHVRQRFQISPLELDEPMYIPYDPPPHVR